MHRHLRARILLVASLLMPSIACAANLDAYELPRAAGGDVIDIHAHFFNFCDLPPQALADPHHVGDHGIKRSLSKGIGKSFLASRGSAAERAAICADVTSPRGYEQLRRPQKYRTLDFLRTAASDRLAIVSQYFKLFPEVGLVTPSMVDADGWLNNPGVLPPVPSWERRHQRQQELAKHVNDHYNQVRVLPIAGFNPIRGVRIDCTKELSFSSPSECNDAWTWRASDASAHGDAYVQEFKHLFQPTGDLPPFIGVKLYPSTGFSPAPHCEVVAALWAGKTSLEDCVGPNRNALCNRIADEAVAIAPLRNPAQWEGLPEPSDVVGQPGNGCYALHQVLTDNLKKHDAKVKALMRKNPFTDSVEYLGTADFEDLRNQIQLVAFLRLSAEIDRVMADLYAMTDELDLPIIAHASPEGFALDDQFYEYGFPNAWEKVLAAHPSMRLLLAHAGGATNTTDPKEGENSFFGEVVKLLSTRPQVYVDFSNRHAQEWSTQGVPGAQVVYGSDFWMMTFGGESEGYLASHRALFPDDSDGYMRDHAIEFLAPAGSKNRDRICGYAKDKLAPKIDAVLCPEAAR